jgi:trans-aconitate methyltransferase
MRKTDWDPGRYEGGHSFVWEFGGDLLALLAPQPGERVLDLGCGTGHLSAKIAAAGATVVGIDPSPAMIGQARQNYPNLTFHLIRAEDFRDPQPFDAVFSNAALHWITDQDAAAETVATVLRPGGRYVLEMGGQGNIKRIDSAVRSQIKNYFPSIGEYATILERHGLEVTNAMLFDRPTPLEGGEGGLRDWVATFRPDNTRPMNEVEEELQSALFYDGRWVADYRRLRMTAARKGEGTPT